MIVLSKSYFAITTGLHMSQLFRKKLPGRPISPRDTESERRPMRTSLAKKRRRSSDLWPPLKKSCTLWQHLDSEILSDCFCTMQLKCLWVCQTAWTGRGQYSLMTASVHSWTIFDTHFLYHRVGHVHIHCCGFREKPVPLSWRYHEAMDRQSLRRCCRWPTAGR